MNPDSLISCPPIPGLGGEFDAIIDVRSPSEYQNDHIPGAINLPVLSDEQRELVGTAYTKEGGFIGKKTGAPIVARNISDHLEGYFADKERGHKVLLYCWRGGMRSGSFATILSSVGYKVSILKGGYKAYRKQVSDELEELPAKFQWVAINGLTGSGKTFLLQELEKSGQQILDLEALANHKGSVLGQGIDTVQPSQKAYESMLREKLVRLDDQRPVFFEAESRKIGSLQNPTALWEAMRASTVLRVELPMEVRVKFLLSDYEYFIQDPKVLCDCLDLLEDIHGESQIAVWKEQIEKKQWEEFVQSILELHYDPLYSKSSNYPEPKQVVSLTDLRKSSVASFLTACADFS